MIYAYFCWYLHLGSVLILLWWDKTLLQFIISIDQITYLGHVHDIYSCTLCRCFGESCQNVLCYSVIVYPTSWLSYTIPSPTLVIPYSMIVLPYSIIVSACSDTVLPCSRSILPCSMIILSCSTIVLLFLDCPTMFHDCLTLFHDLISYPVLWVFTKRHQTLVIEGNFCIFPTFV